MTSQTISSNSDKVNFSIYVIITDFCLRWWINEVEFSFANLHSWIKPKAAGFLLFCFYFCLFLLKVYGFNTQQHLKTRTGKQSSKNVWKEIFSTKHIHLTFKILTLHFLPISCLTRKKEKKKKRKKAGRGPEEAEVGIHTKASTNLLLLFWGEGAPHISLRLWLLDTRT